MNLPTGCSKTSVPCLIEYKEKNDMMNGLYEEVVRFLKSLLTLDFHVMIIFQYLIFFLLIYIITITILISSIQILITTTGTITWGAKR